MSDTIPVQRKWVHVNLPHSKNLASILGNLNDWSKKPLSSPFSRIKKLSSYEDRVELDPWEQSNSIR